MDDAAVEWLLDQDRRRSEHGRAAAAGAIIQKHVEDPVSELLIAAREEKLEAIEVRVGPDGLTVIAPSREPRSARTLTSVPRPPAHASAPDSEYVGKKLGSPSPVWTRSSMYLW